MTSPGDALQFTVEVWAAQAAGLTSQAQWLEWFRQGRPLAREFAPEVSWMPAGLRRRLSPLGRAALSVLALCRPEGSCPVVLASRYGDLEGTARLLTQLVQEGGVSPMGFSLAVHNACVGVDSIARQDRTPATSIAARVDLAEAACFEALGYLACGAPQVLVVCCEDPVPPPYSAKDEGDFRYAWACRLRAACRSGITLTAVSGEPPPADGPLAVLPPTLRALAFLAGTGGDALPSETGRYLWRRDLEGA